MKETLTRPANRGENRLTRSKTEWRSLRAAMTLLMFARPA
jgi:hypothetical protein